MKLTMSFVSIRRHASIVYLICCASLVACGGGGDTVTVTQTSAPTPATDVFETPSQAARFLTQATFGPSPQDIDALQGQSASEWVVDQFDKEPSFLLEYLAEFQQLPGIDEDSSLKRFATTTGFWTHAITAEDQLRQRVAFALSQIIVVSNANDDLFEDFPEPVSGFQDILIEHAFGNYLDMLKAVTYSPTMGRYLTYLGSQKANPQTGRGPDENYAREILQLFSIGLVGLNMDGNVINDEQGNAVELYSNTDITGLARVFTGLTFDVDDPEALIDDDGDIALAFTTPMVIRPRFHSDAEKSFLGLTIPANTDGDTTIDMALEHIVSQPSVAPFIARQLIQRLVTSHPEPDYINRVATAFETGLYTLPNGIELGDGRKGDMRPTIAAILFDPDARHDMMAAQVDLTHFGKVREPILRFTHWARAFEMESVRSELLPVLWDTSGAETLSQHPYGSRSVFNFFRPGYVAPGTESGALGLTMPELQIANASSTTGYINFIIAFTLSQVQEDEGEWAEVLAEEGINFDVTGAGEAFVPNFEPYLVMAQSPTELVDTLSAILLTDALSDDTRELIVNAVSQFPLQTNDPDVSGAERRVQLAIILLMTSSDYLVQR